MMRSNAFAVFIYIIVKLFNCCAAQPHPTEYSQTTLNYHQYKLITLPTIGLFETNNNVSSERHQNNDFLPHQLANNEIQSSQRRFSVETNSTENYFDINKNSTITSMLDKLPRNKRNAEREDICNIAECSCNTETKFLTVDCHFQQVSKIFLFLVCVDKIVCYSI